jgi:glycosyltransferase involved in cell wall biosynthesis
MVVDSLDGGLGRAVLNGSAWLHDRGWEVLLVGPPDGDASSVAGDLAVIDLPTSARDLRTVRAAARAVRARLDAFCPDVVHCHGLRSFFLTRVVGRRPAMLTLHTMLKPGSVADDPPGYHFLRSAAIAALPKLAQHAFSVAPGVVGGYEFAPHASPRLAELDRLPPPPPGAPFLWVARLQSPKQPVEFVRAVSAAAVRQPAVRARMAGSGPLTDATTSAVDELGAPVDRLGERDDVVELLGGSRAVVLLSRGEGVPLAAIEAMWAGRPVIASSLPGTHWLAGDGGHGMTLVGDHDETVEALVRLADDDTAADEGAAAARRIRAILDVDSPWPQVERAYRRALERG